MRISQFIGLPYLKANVVRKVICCSRQGGVEVGYSYIHVLTPPFTKRPWPSLKLWHLSSTSIVTMKDMMKFTVHVLILFLVSDTVTWTQSPSGGSPSVGLHPLLFGALTPPNWISWGLSAAARTGLCWQCRWCYPLSSGHTSTACTHCCPRLHHDVCSYLQSWTGKNYLRGEHVGLKPVKYLGCPYDILLCLAVIPRLANERTVLG